MITMQQIQEKLESLNTKGYWGVKKAEAYFKITEPLVHATISHLNLRHVCPDDSLNCAQSWESFGDYKARGFTEDHDYVVVRPETVYRDWVGNVQVNPNQIPFVWDRTANLFYTVEKRGSSWDHSENNTEPEVSCFGVEIQKSEITDYDFEEIEWVLDHEAEIDRLIDDHYHKQELETVKTNINIAQTRLNRCVTELEDLKVNHKRAYKKIENAEKRVEQAKSSLSNYEKQLSKLVAE